MHLVKHRGAAIILALMITAIVASIAATMMYRQRISINEATLVFNYDRMSLLADQATAWAKNELTLQKPQTGLIPVTSLLANSYNVFKPFVLASPQGIKLTATLQDQQGLFNLNCLADKNNQYRFIQLLESLDSNINPQQALKLAKAVTAWLTAKNTPDMMVSTSELRIVPGITQSLYELLAPYITVLPITKYQLNILTAPMPLLVTLAPGLTLNKAKALQTCQRQQGQAATTTSFQTCATALGVTNISTVITTTSQYFSLKIHAQAEDQQLTQENLLYRFISRAPPPSKATVLKTQLLTSTA